MKKMTENAMRIANGGKTYTCEFCGKKFKYYILWNQHQITELIRTLRG